MLARSLLRARPSLPGLAALLLISLVPCVTANPVPADDLSLLNGADLYQEHCASCHGFDLDPSASSFYTSESDDGLYDFSDVVDAAFAEPARPEVPENWPEWADPPPQPLPGTQPDTPNDRELMLAELTAAIDDVYAGAGDEMSTDPGLAPLDEPGATPAEGEASGDGGEAQDQADAAQAQDRAPEATDLVAPGSFVYGTSEAELFDSIALGAGVGMPPMLERLGSEEAVWNLVNYIRSLWGEDWVDTAP